MADNVAITPGSGATVRTDDISGVQIQVVKIALGADGAEDLLIDSGQQTKANSLPVAIASDQGALPVSDNSTTLSVDDGAGSLTVDVGAGESHIGEIGGKTTLTAITFSLDTNIYADGDVLADTQVLAACLRVNDGTGIIQDVIFNDKDDQGLAFDVLVLSADTSMGAENGAPDASDADADTIVGRFSVGVGDFYDLGACRIASIKNIGIAVKGATGTDDIYVALISRGAGTYSASGITAIFKILCD